MTKSLIRSAVASNRDAWNASADGDRDNDQQAEDFVHLNPPRAALWGHSFRVRGGGFSSWRCRRGWRAAQCRGAGSFPGRRRGAQLPSCGWVVTLLLLGKPVHTPLIGPPRAAHCDAIPASLKGCGPSAHIQVHRFKRMWMGFLSLMAKP